MDLFAFSAQDLMSFLLTLIRISVLVFMLPFYSTNAMPVQLKGALTLVLSMVLWPHLSFNGAYFSAHPIGITLMLISEAIMGLVLSLAVQFVFVGIQSGGELLGYQMGFSMISFADPLSGNQTGATAHFLYMVSMLTFLSLEGHLLLLGGLAQSFQIVPPGGFTVNPQLAIDVIAMSKGIFVVALKIAAPVMAAVLLSELALALMGRAAPQMNLMTMGFPVKIAVGFFFIALLFKAIAARMELTAVDMGPMFRHFLRLGI